MCMLLCDYIKKLIEETTYVILGQILPTDKVFLVKPTIPKPINCNRDKRKLHPYLNST